MVRGGKESLVVILGVECRYQTFGEEDYEEFFDEYAVRGAAYVTCDV